MESSVPSQSKANHSGDRQGPENSGLGTSMVGIYKGIRSLRRFREARAKRKGKGEDDVSAETVDKIKNEARVEAWVGQHTCDPSSSGTTTLHDHQQTKLSESIQISPSHPSSSTDDLTADDGEITDSHDASSSDRTWSLASISRALQSPGVTTTAILTQCQARLVDNLMLEFHALINSEGFLARSRPVSEGPPSASGGPLGGTNIHKYGHTSSNSRNKKRHRDQSAGNNRSEEDQDQGGEPPKMQRILSYSCLSSNVNSTSHCVSVLGGSTIVPCGRRRSRQRDRRCSLFLASSSWPGTFQRREMSLSNCFWSL